jgi:choline dehydrogenase-like flavoprotein
VKITDLAATPPGATFDADLVIVGGGPAGLTLAREFFGSDTRVLVIESGGRRENADSAELNRVESIGEPASPEQAAKREAFHSALAGHWRADVQPFGVRCRGLGGSTQAWAGKSASFDAIDFEARDWIPGSGWPVSRAELEPYFDRAAAALNLGPNTYGEDFWALAGQSPPEPALDRRKLRPFFWQFARSRIDHMDVMRFGDEFLTEQADNVSLLLNATVTKIETRAASRRVEGLEVAAPDRTRFRVAARHVVLAAGGIENARLLLANGIGNGHDQVGRCLMDHPSVRIARFGKKQAQILNRRFGFVALNHGGRAHLYMQGLSLSPEIQRSERLNHTALYMLEERSPDDPLMAIKRLVKRQSKAPLTDAWSAVKSPGMVFKAVGVKLLQSGRVPKFIKDLMVNTVILFNPRFVAREFQSGGLPHKLTGLSVDAITEQAPDSESRVMLSDTLDGFGVPIARIQWTIDPGARRSLLRIAELMAEAFAVAGLPAPQLEDWVREQRPGDAVIIDMGHTLGTTRMSADPARGVVDTALRVHGMENLSVAGGSVFPTSGHANPTLMILSLTIRLADRLKAELSLPAETEKISA